MGPFLLAVCRLPLFTLCDRFKVEVGGSHLAEETRGSELIIANNDNSKHKSRSSKRTLRNIKEGITRRDEILLMCRRWSAVVVVVLDDDDDE